MLFYINFYIIIIGISVFFYMLCRSGKEGIKTQNYNKVSYLYFTGIILISVMGMRGVNVGADTYPYGKIFRVLGQIPLAQDVSKSLSGYWGYRLLCKVVFKLLGDNYQVFLFIIAILTIGGIYRFIYYTSENYILSVLLFIVSYLYFNSWNISRQFCAVAIGVNAAVELFRNKKIRSIVLFVIACMFHNAAIVLIVMYPLKMIQWNKRRFAIYSFCLLMGTNMLEPFMKLFCFIFPRYGYIYAKYLRTGITTSFGSIAQGRKMLVSIFFLFLIIVSIIVTEDKKHNSGFISDWFMMAMIMIEIVIGIVFRQNNVMLRFQIFFTVFIIAGIPNLLSRIHFKQSTRLLVSIGTLVILTVPFLVQLSDNYGKIVPYNVIWK